MPKYTRVQLERILDSTDSRCHLCWGDLRIDGYPTIWEVDHNQPKLTGGPNTFRNLKPAHVSCNRSKQAQKSKAVRLEKGHARAPKSKEARQRGAAQGALLGLGAAAVLHPAGWLAGTALGWLVGGGDPDKSVKPRSKRTPNSKKGIK